MLQLFEFALMSYLQENICCVLKEYDTLILIVRLVEFELLF